MTTPSVPPIALAGEQDQARASRMQALHDSLWDVQGISLDDSALGHVLDWMESTAPDAAPTPSASSVPVRDAFEQHIFERDYPKREKPPLYRNHENGIATTYKDSAIEAEWIATNPAPTGPVASDALKTQFGEGRPLSYTLDNYWTAPGGDGPLSFEWKDKPHRLIYDLIAALVFVTHDAAPPANAKSSSALTDEFEKAFQLIFSAYAKPGMAFTTDTEHAYWLNGKVTEAFTHMQKARALLQANGATK